MCRRPLRRDVPVGGAPAMRSIRRSSSLATMRFRRNLLSFSAARPRRPHRRVVVAPAARALRREASHSSRRRGSVVPALRTAPAPLPRRNIEVRRIYIDRDRPDERPPPLPELTMRPAESASKFSKSQEKAEPPDRARTIGDVSPTAARPCAHYAGPALGSLADDARAVEPDIG
jgi:hypothetical protein